MECGLAAWCAEVLFEAAAADPSLTSARLHVSFLEVTESAVYDIMASNPQGRGSKQDQREPWMEFDPKSDNVGANLLESSNGVSKLVASACKYKKLILSMYLVNACNVVFPATDRLQSCSSMDPQASTWHQIFSEDVFTATFP